MSYVTFFNNDFGDDRVVMTRKHVADNKSSLHIVANLQQK